MSSLNSPTDVGSAAETEPVERIFRRMLLRLALVCGIGVAALAWNAGSVVALLTLVPALAVSAGATALRVGEHFRPAAVSTVRFCVGFIGVAAVVTLAGVAGLLLAGLCLALSDTVRRQSRRLLTEARRAI